MGQSWCESEGISNKHQEIFKIPIEQLQCDSPQIVQVFRYPKRLLIPVSNNTCKTQDHLQIQIRFRADLTESVSLDVQLFKYSQRKLTNLLETVNINGIIEDNYYSNRDHFKVQMNEQSFSLLMRNCYNSSEFLEAAYQLNTYWKIKNLNSKYLHQIKDCFCISDEKQKEYCLVSMMEPINCNLTEIVRHKRDTEESWSESEFLQLFRDLVEALHALHLSGITHNDIRSSNIFFSEEKSAFILGSFGSARNCVEQTASSARNLGRNARGSRKIARLEDFHLSSSNLRGEDVYSLGMVLLSAFYLCDNIDRKKSAPFTRALSSQFSCLTLIKEMIKQTEHRKTIAEIKAQLSLIQSFELFIPSFSPKQLQHNKDLDKNNRTIAFAYKSLGLSSRWRETMKDFLITDQTIKDTPQNARIFIELANHSLSQGKTQQSKIQFKHAAKIYSALGQSNFIEACFKQSAQYYKLGLYCLDSIPKKQSLKVYKRLHTGLVQTEVIGGFIFPSEDEIINLQCIIEEIKSKDPHEYWLLCKRLIRIYNEIKQYRKVEQILVKALLVMQKICDKVITFEIKQLQLRNQFRVCLFIPPQEKMRKLSQIANKITNILSQYEYFLLQREYIKLQLNFLLLKAIFLQQYNSKLWDNLLTLKQKLTKIIQSKHKPPNLNPKCQYLQLAIEIHIQLGDINTQIKKSSSNTIQYYSTALDYSRCLNGDLYNPKCLQILEKISIIYRKIEHTNIYTDCQQTIKNIKNSIFGPLKQLHQYTKSQAQDSTTARVSQYEQRVYF